MAKIRVVIQKPVNSSSLGVQTVTGNGVDNTDPQNPILSFPDTSEVTETTDKKYVTDAEKVVISNTSGTNTGDETISTIKTKRPIKTVNSQSLEGSGNIDLSSFELAEWYGATGDGVTDDSAAIQNALNVGSVSLLGKTYLVSSPIIVPLGKTLTGVGHNSILKSDFLSGSVLTIEAEGRVQDLKMIGDSAFSHDDINSNSLYPENLTELDARKGEGLLTGITTNNKQCSINNVYFTQFSKNAIYTFENAAVQTSQPLRNDISNNVFYLNYISLFESERSEYGCFVNNVFKYNIVGIIVEGGNNSHTNNKIDHSRFGVVLEGDPLINNAHGEFTGGSINHSKIYCFVARVVQYGEMLTGISIFDGGSEGLLIQDSKGITIDNCTFSSVKTVAQGEYNSVNDSGQNRIANSFYRQNSTTGAYTFTATGNTIAENNSSFEGDEENTTWNTQMLNNTKYDRDNFYYKDVNGQNSIVGNDAFDFNAGGSSINGDLKITLPVGLSNQMFSVDLQVMGNVRNMNYTIFGWALAAGWANPKVSYKNGDDLFTVDFGKDVDGNGLIYVNVSANWRYEMIRITKVVGFRGSINRTNDYKYEWNMEITNEVHQNVTATYTPT